MNRSIKIIALNGSPNQSGNTTTLMEWVADGAEEQGADVEWIHLNDININYCKGCNTCLKTGKCIIKDELPIILNKLGNANGFIVGSPVYGGGLTAQLKTLFDRITLLKLYADILESGFSVGVSTSGIAPTKSVAKEAASFFGHRIGHIGVKCATLNGGFKPLDIDSDHKKKDEAKDLGMKLVLKCLRGGQKLSLEYAWINFLRKVFLKRMIRRNKEQFQGVIKIWQKKGWL